jgi:type IV pilus assembly protein PilV
LDGLIAVVLFSIGILGMVGLQALSITHASNAKYRTDAAMYADQLIAQMWAGAKGGGLAVDFTTGGPAYRAWNAQVTASLPGADTTPPTVAFDGSQVTIVLHWNSPGERAVHNYTTVSQIVP